MNSISPNLNVMIKASEKASKSLIRDFGELENLQVSLKGPSDFVTSADKKVEKMNSGNGSEDYFEDGDSDEDMLENDEGVEPDETISEKTATKKKKHRMK